MHGGLVFEILNEGHVEFHLHDLIRVGMGNLEYLRNDLSVVEEFVEDGITSWQDVVNHDLYLLLVDFLNCDFVLIQLFHNFPVQERETQVAHMHAPTVVYLVVHCKHFLVQTEGLPLVLQLIG